MQFKRTIVAVAALSVPASAGAITASASDNPSDPVASTAAVAHAAAHRKALKRNVRLARIRAHRSGRPLSTTAYARRAKRRSLEDLQRSNRRLRVTVTRLRHQRAMIARLRPTLHTIAACESGRNPRAVSASGRYRGLFQFDTRTWAAAGGRGDPARASVQEQYRRAAITYTRRGAAPWPVCGR